MSLLGKIQTSAFATQRRLRGDDVTYTRTVDGGSDIVISLEDIVQGRTEWKGLGAGGVVVISESKDFFIPAAELLDGETLLEPERGDQITVTTDALTMVFDVMNFGPDDLLSRWHDRDGRTVRRVFTKLLSEGAV